LPLILAGQSLGGSISLKLALKKPKEFKLIILLAPAIMDWKQNMKFLKNYIMPVAAFLVPTLPTI